MSTAVVHTLEIAQEYLAAWKRKDAVAISRLLHPDVHLNSPVAELTGREPFLMMCRKIFAELEDVNVRAMFASDTQAMLVYDFVLKKPIGVTRTANLMTFEGEMIRSVELFFDARPFEKSADKTRTSA
jgi:SnoaL-like domain